MMTTEINHIEYGLKWFKYHSGQRIAMVRFFSTLFFGIATGISYFIGAKIVAGSITLSLILIFVSLVFWQIDVRSRQLIEIGESIIDHYWTISGGSADLNPIRLSRSKNSEGIRFKQAFGLLYALGIMSGIASFVFAIAQVQ